MPYFPDGMPVPIADPLTEPYWSATREHRLVIQRCTACGTFRNLPHELCGNCQSPEHEWVESAGRGTVFTYTIAGHPVHEALNDSVPYNVVVVQLDDCGGVLVPSNLVDCVPGEIAVGLRVELTWEDVAEGVSVPRFRAADES
jgi:uncharacterized OB-fold protein